MGNWGGGVGGTDNWFPVCNIYHGTCWVQHTLVFAEVVWVAIQA